MLYGITCPRVSRRRAGTTCFGVARLRPQEHIACDMTSGARTYPRAMGQGQSREEQQARSAVLRSAAAGLRHEEDGHTPGKLKRPSLGRTMPSTSMQRSMKRPPRADPLEVPESPDELRRTQKRKAADTQPFSPLKRQTQPPRRSPRTQQSAQRSEQQTGMTEADGARHRTTRQSAARAADVTVEGSHETPTKPSPARKGRGRPRRTGSLDRAKAQRTPARGARAADKERAVIAQIRPEDVSFAPGRNNVEDTVHTSTSMGDNDAHEETGGGVAEQDGADAIEDQDDEDDGTNKNGKAKAKKASQSGSGANTSAKRGPALDKSRSLDAQQQRRLFGLWPDLLRIVQCADAKIAENIRCDDKHVKDLVKRCKLLTKHFENAEVTKGKTDDPWQDDPEGEIAAVAAIAENLCASGEKLKGDHHTNRGDDIFANLMPVLVKLLAARVCDFERHGEARGDSLEIQPDHELVIIEMMQFIRDVGETAFRSFRPHQDYPIKSHIRSGITIPLRILGSNLQKHYTRRIRAAEALERATQDHALRRQRQQREERLARQANFRNQLEDKWKDLHVRRNGVEGNPIRFGVKAGRAKTMHLAYPDYQPELDFNGEPFQRMQVFSVRVGPTQPAIDRARDLHWTMPELDALNAGLKRHPGEHVFEDIISRHCIPNGLLNRFNVTEIVVKAADLKSWWEERQMDRLGFVDDWVQAIPVWTRAHAMPGQENEEMPITVDDDEDLEVPDDESDEDVGDEDVEELEESEA